jgi:hypothetical protein
MPHSEHGKLFFARSERIERAFRAVQLSCELIHGEAAESLLQNEINEGIT